MSNETGVKKLLEPLLDGRGGEWDRAIEVCMSALASVQTGEAAAKEEVQRLAEALRKCKRSHHYCEDTWYSCPMHEEGCANGQETECNCGADEHNAWIDSILAAHEPKEK